MSAFLTRCCPHHVEFSVPTCCTMCRLDETRARVAELETGISLALQSLDSALGRLESAPSNALTFVEIDRSTDDIDEAIHYLKGTIRPAPMPDKSEDR